MERRLRDKLPGGKFENVSATDSRRMGAIRGRGNSSTEARFRAMLVCAGVRGWTMQTKAIKGKPDFYFAAGKVVVFLDGCFWHGCPRCGHVPKANRPFWKAKIERNQERDRETDQHLQGLGVRVLRLWEHELRDDAAACLKKLDDLLSPPRPSGTRPGGKRKPGAIAPGCGSPRG
jgi:DNA mismatch endonuclease (patch repair protein)